mgnify:CR=1 FL=1
MNVNCPEATKNHKQPDGADGSIVALEALNRPCQVDLYSDSKYLVDAFNQHWIDSWLKKKLETWKKRRCEERRSLETPFKGQGTASGKLPLG